MASLSIYIPTQTPARDEQHALNFNNPQSPSFISSHSSHAAEMCPILFGMERNCSLTAGLQQLHQSCPTLNSRLGFGSSTKKLNITQGVYVRPHGQGGYSYVYVNVHNHRQCWGALVIIRRKRLSDCILLASRARVGF